VSRAAEAAREAQATAEALAADDVASLARSTAAELRSRADELAVMVSAAASEAAPNAHGIGTDPTSSRLSDEAADAAAANARETENAAHIVADAVAQAAATVAATTAATAAAKQQEVADAAAAVRILAEAAARNIAAATQGAGPLDAHFDVDSATRRIAVHGQLDAATAHHIAAAFAGLQIGDDGDITIELSDVTSMDLAGLGVIDCARATQTDRRQRLRVSGAGDRARELFALAALTDLLADPQL
jgi:anti-anti-sigma factor